MHKNENHRARDITPTSGYIGQQVGMEPEVVTEGKGFGRRPGMPKGMRGER